MGEDAFIVSELVGAYLLQLVDALQAAAQETLPPAARASATQNLPGGDIASEHDLPSFAVRRDQRISDRPQCSG